MAEHASEHAHEWETSIYPLPLAVGILLLIPMPFMLHFVWEMSTASILCLSVGTILTVYSVGGWISESIEDKYGWSEGNIVGAMPFFIIAEAFIFIALLVSYWYLKLSANVWPPPGTPEFEMGIPLFMTLLLVSSSFTIHCGEQRLDEGDTDGFIRLLVITIILGVLFLGCTAMEWAHFLGEGFTISTNAKGTSFYSVTGFHASHVFVGLGIFIGILLPALRGGINKPFVHAGSIYWHFVDLVWFFVVSQMYFW